MGDEDDEVVEGWPFLVTAGDADAMGFAAGSSEGRIALWDRDGRLLRCELQPGGIHAIATAAGSARAAACGDTVMLWDGDDLGAATALRGHQASVMDVAVGCFDDELRVASVGSDRSVRLWRRGAGGSNFTGTVIGRHSEIPRGVSLSHSLIASAGGVDRSVQLRTLDGQVAACLLGHTDHVSHVALGQLEGGDVVVSGSLDGTARVWRVSGEPIATLQVHRDGVTAIAVAEWGILTAGQDRRVRAWDGQGQLISTTPALHTGRVLHVRPDGDGFLTASGKDQTVRRWSRLAELLAATKLQYPAPVDRPSRPGPFPSRGYLVADSDDLPPPPL